MGSHSLHLWHRPKSRWEETLVWERQGGVDSGKRLFSYQRVIANAISCEHLCLWKMNRTPRPRYPSRIPAVPGCRVRPRAVPWLQSSSRALRCPAALQPRVAPRPRGTH